MKLSKIFKLLVILGILISLLNCSNSVEANGVEPEQPEQPEQTEVIQVVTDSTMIEEIQDFSKFPDADMKRFLGGGYNSFGDFIGLALEDDFSAYWKPLRQEINKEYYGVVESVAEMENLVDKNYNYEVDSSGFWCKSGIWDNYNISKKQLACVYVIHVVKGYALIGDDASLTKRAFELFSNSQSLFKKWYGTHFVSKVLIGEKFMYMKYFDASEESDEVVAAIKKELKEGFEKIINGDTEYNMTEEVLNISNNVDVSEHLYSSVIPMGEGNESGNFLTRHIKAFKKNIPNEIHEFSGIRMYLTPYDDIAFDNNKDSK